MGQDTIMTDEDGTKYSYENIKTQGWLDGHYSGLDAAVNYLKEMAVQLFRDGKDEQATRLRKMAEDMRAKLEPDMRKRAKQHEKDYPAIVEDEDNE